MSAFGQQQNLLLTDFSNADTHQFHKYMKYSIHRFKNILVLLLCKYL